MATIGSHHYASDGVLLEYLDERDHLPSLSEVPCTWGGSPSHCLWKAPYLLLFNDWG